MRKLFFIVLLFDCLIVFGQNTGLNIVPAPAEVNLTGGFLVIKEPIGFIVNDGSDKDPTILFRDFLRTRLNFKKFVDGDTHSYGLPTEIFINYDNNYQPREGYTLEITKKNIRITGNEHGVFNAFQTLQQLFPIDYKKEIKIPCGIIKDHPRFPYRGIHLDVCRHFFPVSFIKKYIDHLATYKFNKFHWHLTEDQGWRIEIKKYPKLTSVGAQRNGTLIGRYPGKGNDNKPYGGFYTQAQIKEVVAYAASRHIEVIPEIEMPGHGSAAIAAYPWLSCFPKKPTEIPKNMISQKSIDEQKNGRIKLVQETWGVFDDIFCAGKDSTFKFLENVIDEVATLFPSKYFHMGGDEAPKTHWKQCPACQQRMKDNNLKDEHELQSWFVRRIERYVNSKGKILIGWDEILEGGLAPNAVVMSWRGESGGIEAAKQKHNVIMSPGNPLYFDHTQSNNEDSVTFGGYNPIENVYAYDPVPKALTEGQGKYILGAQANMWTEYQSNTRKIEYQLFPRITALSEVLWTPKEKKDWKDFERRLPVIYERLDKQKTNYSKAYYDLQATVMPTAEFNGIEWKLESKDKDLSIHYETILPVGKRYNYEKPIRITENTIINAWASTGKTNSNKILAFFKFNKATGKKISLVTAPSSKYPGDGAFTLVNGVQNDKGMNRSTEFLGFLGTDMEAMIDLGKETEFKTVIVNSLTQPGSWIYQPKHCYFLISDDGINFKELPGLISQPETINNRKTSMQKADGSSISARYVKVVAKNFGIIPEGNPGAGTPAWLFVDEIEID